MFVEVQICLFCISKFSSDHVMVFGKYKKLKMLLEILKMEL